MHTSFERIAYSAEQKNTAVSKREKTDAEVDESKIKIMIGKK